MDHPAIKWGIISGLCNIIYMLVLYIIDPQNLFGALPLISLIIHLVCMVIAGLEFRSEQGGALSWINGTKITLLTYAIASFLYVCFYYVLYNFVDPGLAEMQEKVSYEALEAISQWMTEEQMDEAIEALEEESFDVTSQLLH